MIKEATTFHIKGVVILLFSLLLAIVVGIIVDAMIFQVEQHVVMHDVLVPAVTQFIRDHFYANNGNIQAREFFLCLWLMLASYFLWRVLRSSDLTQLKLDLMYGFLLYFAVVASVGTFFVGALLWPYVRIYGFMGSGSQRVLVPTLLHICFLSFFVLAVGLLVAVIIKKAKRVVGDGS